MKLTCTVIIALTLPLVLCGQARAQHTGPYVGAFVGGNALMTSKATDHLGNFSLKFDPALLGSAVAGWDIVPGNSLGEGRIELEYSHRSNPLNKTTFIEGGTAGSGTMTADSLLLNFFGVFHDKSPWSPYIGAGFGAARMRASDLKVIDQPLGSGSSIVFAYQLGAGVDVALGNKISLDLGYRFFNSIKPTFTEASGSTFKMEYFSHSAVLGMRFGF